MYPEEVNNIIDFPIVGVTIANLESKASPVLQQRWNTELFASLVPLTKMFYSIIEDVSIFQTFK